MPAALAAADLGPRRPEPPRIALPRGDERVAHAAHRVVEQAVEDDRDARTVAALRRLKGRERAPCRIGVLEVEERGHERLGRGPVLLVASDVVVEALDGD